MGRIKPIITAALLMAVLLCVSGCRAAPVGMTIPLVYGDGADAVLETAELFGDSDEINLADALELSGLSAAQSAWVYAGTGHIVRVEVPEVSLSRDGILSAGIEKFTDCDGILLDGPGRYIGEVYDISKEALDAGERVLIFYLDGFGYNAYSEALARGDIPVIASFDGTTEAAAAFPTITPVNYAAMTTSEVPAQTGVTDRSAHGVQIATIFDHASALGVSSSIVEGDKQILQFSINQEIHPDFDGDGDTDDEIFETALKAVQGDTGLVFVHFHGIDDVSHAYGPGSSELREKIIETDAMLGELTALWEGLVIITADHGQHENDGGGDPEYSDKKGSHGSFLASDLLVPIISGPGGLAAK